MEHFFQTVNGKTQVRVTFCYLVIIFYCVFNLLVSLALFGQGRGWVRGRRSTKIDFLLQDAALLLLLVYLLYNFDIS